MDKKKKILVLGAKGMLGSTVYKYFKQNYINVFGTDRHIDSKLFLLRAEFFQKDLKQILKEIENIDYIVNCVGILPNVKDKKLMAYVNTSFPKKLAYFAEKAGIRVISISSDAVFPANSGKVFENSLPEPDNFYGDTKLKGEVNRKNVLNIRTSIIGLDKNNNRGLLEWTLNNKNAFIDGYTNQKWSGCTTLQYAKLCNYIIQKNNFTKLRNKSSVFHYISLGPVSKYDLLSEFVKVAGLNIKVRKTEGKITIDRQLKSIYNIFLKEDLSKSLKDIFEFNNTG